MKLQLLYSLTIFLVAFVATTHAAISPEVYWKIKLPNTQIPKVKHLLPKQPMTLFDTRRKYAMVYQHGAWIFHAATEEEIREITNESLLSTTPANSDLPAQ
ncbi:hypothetical protein HAX54_010665 [Datura stramonium]|uniref:Uncharacterized protein n=1 Tax=Datura stramonium TaxID=4076 RepID=A0ABS8TII3_DATST|nr:hypothetical protein [Datura stramonium]